MAAPALPLADRRTWSGPLGVLVVAVVSSIVAYVVVLANGTSLAYPDAVSHLLIARRVIDSTTPGFAQLGSVWLPLPHLLSLPFVWISPLFYSGFAGTIVSMAAFVATAYFLQRLVIRLTDSTMAGWVAALVFMTNPGVLYLQSTPMTELLLLASMTAGVYGIVRWGEGARYEWLVFGGFGVLLATLSRYEGWVVLLTLAGVVVLSSLTSLPGRDGLEPGSAERSWRRRVQWLDGHLVLYLSVAAFGVVVWLVWNRVLFGDWLAFQRGDYAKPSLWVSATDPAVGDLWVSIRTYAYAVAGNFGGVVAVVSMLGLVVLVVRRGLRTETLAVLSLLVMAPFYVLGLYSGQRPLHVAEINGDLYNTRFGMAMVIPIAIGLGVLASVGRDREWRNIPVVLVLGLVVGTSLGMANDGEVTVLQEAKVFSSSPVEQRNAQAAAWWQDEYDGGLVLMEGFGNETVMFEARIPLDRIVYEGSDEQWEPALADPSGSGIRWIYMRTGTNGSDQVSARLGGTSALAGYELVYQDDDRQIFREPTGTDLADQELSS